MTSVAELIVKALATIILAIILAYVLIAVVGDAQSEMQSSSWLEPLPTSSYDPELDYLDKQALAEAYQKHVVKLFENWMHDPTGQPARAQRGYRNGRKAYIDAMTALDARTK